MFNSNYSTEGFGFLSAAADPGGAELCSFAPVDVSLLCPSDDPADMSCSAPDPLGAELCSFAPEEVSAPRGAALSAARPGATLIKTNTAATDRERVIGVSFFNGLPVLITGRALFASSQR